MSLVHVFPGDSPSNPGTAGSRIRTSAHDLDMDEFSHGLAEGKAGGPARA